MKRIILFLVAASMLFFPGNAAALSPSGSFSDVSGHWAQQDIEVILNLGLMNGTGTTDQGSCVFSPDNAVSRAQLASVLQRTFHFDYGQIRFFKQPLASDYYRDVDDTAWYADELVMCMINGIFDSADYFRPNQPVSRLEMARSIYRSFNSKGISIPMIMIMPIYEDTGSLSQEDTNAITFVSNTGIMKGNGQYFGPDQELKRAELAGILSRCVSLMAINEDYNNKEYTVPVGQNFFISLNSNPSTGYSWNIKTINDKNILAPMGNTYRSNDYGNNLLGQAGKELWQFKALQAGTAELQLTYARPWESVQPAQTFTLKVNVTQPLESANSIKVGCKPIKSNSGTMGVDLKIPVLSGLDSNDAQANINTLWEKDALDLRNKMADEIEAYVKENQQNNWPIRPYQLSTAFEETYQTEEILSLYVDYYQYTGGAHGITDRRPYNINLEDGSKLALKDLFNANYDYQTIINDEIRKQIDAHPDNYFTGDMGFKGINPDQSYYLQNGFLVVYFSQYEIAPYAAGIPEFKIPLSKFQNGIRTELL